MLRDQADRAPTSQPPGSSNVLRRSHGRYSGAAESAGLRHAAHLQVTAGNVPVPIRRDGTSDTTNRKLRSSANGTAIL